MSSVTIGEEPDEDGQYSALVVVPDNQLSLAIGKKGQNARLAAKLTLMRIDIKSEGEVEAERAEAEEVEAGRMALATFPGATPEALEALAAAGLRTPRSIAAAGRERITEIAGHHGAEIHAAAEGWVAARAPKPEEEPAAAEPEHPPATA